MVRITRRALTAGVLCAAFGSFPVLAEEAPARGGTLNLIAQPEPATLAIGLNLQAPTLYVGGKIFQGLLTYSEKLEPLPSLAESWSISPDGLEYRFNLRRNVKWHDGNAFTSADVVFAADKLMRESHPRWKLIANAYVESIVADGPDTVTFRLKKPFSAFIYAFEVTSLPILPKHVYEGTEYRNNPANLAPIGTGPYKFKEWKRGQYIHLVRNETYFKPGLPYLDEIYFRIIPDAASRAIAFDQKMVDILRPGDVEGFEARRIAATPGVVSTDKGEEMYSPLAFLQMNLRKPPFDNVYIRRAVMHALDRDFIAKNIWFGQARPAIGPVASATKFYEEALPKYPYDLKIARDLVVKSGLQLNNVELKLTPLPYGQQWDRLAEYIKQQLNRIGLNVVIQGTDVAGWSQALSEWNFDIALNYTYQYGHPALGVARHYLSSNIIKGTPAANNEGYANPEVDRLLTEAAGAKDSATAQKLYSDAQKLLVDDVALGWLFELKNVILMRQNLRNVVKTAIGVTDTLEDVWIAK